MDSVNCFQKTNTAWVFSLSKYETYKLIGLTLMGIYLQFVSGPGVIFIILTRCLGTVYTEQVWQSTGDRIGKGATEAGSPCCVPRVRRLPGEGINKSVWPREGLGSPALPVGCRHLWQKLLSVFSALSPSIHSGESGSHRIHPCTFPSLLWKSWEVFLFPHLPIKYRHGTKRKTRLPAAS